MTTRDDYEELIKEMEADAKKALYESESNYVNVLADNVCKMDPIISNLEVAIRKASDGEDSKELLNHLEFALVELNEIIRMCVYRIDFTPGKISPDHPIAKRLLNFKDRP